MQRPHARLHLHSSASTLLVLALRPPLEDLLPHGRGLDRALADAFLVTAPLEELAKASAFALLMLGNRNLDEPLDGVVYGAAAGLGFACVENVLYVLDSEHTSTAFFRGFTATLAHLTTGATCGFGLALARFQRGGRRLLLGIGGLLAAILLHGCYDLFLIAEGGLAWISLVGVLPLACVALGMKIRFARARSPHRPAGLAGR